MFPDCQTLAGFPVADDNFLYGVLLFIDKTKRDFDQHEQETIMIACRMLAGNIRQALLHEEAKKRIAELAVLFDVAKAIGSTMELNFILERVVSISAKVLNARGASLRIVDEQSQHVHVSSEYGVIPKGNILHGNSCLSKIHGPKTDRPRLLRKLTGLKAQSIIMPVFLLI